MKFTDIFIKRPVLAAVVSLLLIALGLMSYSKLTWRQFPKIMTPVINVSTSFPGASPDLMDGFVTNPIQNAIADVEGIDFMTGRSGVGSSTVTVYLEPGYDVNTAQNQISAKVQAAKASLPQGINDPVISQVDNSLGILYLGFSSDVLDPPRLTHYLNLQVKPKLQAVSGVANVSFTGDNYFAMRIWLDMRKMAAYDVTASDVMDALNQNNVQSSVGGVEGKWEVLSARAATSLKTVDDFANIAIREDDNNKIVYLKDVAKVELGSNQYTNSVLVDGKQAMVLMIQGRPTANPLDVARGIKTIWPDIQNSLPVGVKGEILIDTSTFIEDSIHTVVHTILEATVIVLFVILLTLGSIRSVLIPVLTIPISLIGVCILMLMLGFSINILTLMALVLAIGLVVDDAIVVVENVSRYLEQGQTPFNAAMVGAREIALPVISMTITLAAVYTPIGMMGGLTGGLFSEFAFTLAGAVIISGIVALTLSPMLCSKLLSKEQIHGQFVKLTDRYFEWLRKAYEGLLHQVMKIRPVMVALAALILFSCYYMMTSTPSELAPSEDQNLLIVEALGPTNSSSEYTARYMYQLGDIFDKIPEKAVNILSIADEKLNRGQGFLLLKSPHERERSQDDIKAEIQEKASHIAGMTFNPNGLPTLPGDDGPPVQFIITSTDDFNTLNKYATELVQRARDSGLFSFVDTTQKLDRPEAVVNIDRKKAADLGITNQEIADALSVSLSQNYITRFDLDGQAYRVIPQLARDLRTHPEIMKQIHVRGEDGSMIPLSNVISIKREVAPSALYQFNQINSTTITGSMNPGHSLSEGVNFLTAQLKDIAPPGVSHDYMGESRRMIQEGHRMMLTFFGGIVIIFLVLAAQFESFRDPFVILISVPMSLAGALLPLKLGYGTLNIFSQIGLLTLVGLISKHGILIVEFANHIQISEQLDKLQAVIKAAGLRLRPILMTTGAMVFGVIPLLLSHIGLVNSQRAIAMTILAGMSIGTLFTLFMVPVFYTLIATDKRSQADMPIDTKKLNDDTTDDDWLIESSE